MSSMLAQRRPIVITWHGRRKILGGSDPKFNQTLSTKKQYGGLALALGLVEQGSNNLRVIEGGNKGVTTSPKKLLTEQSSSVMKNHGSKHLSSCSRKRSTEHPSRVNYDPGCDRPVTIHHENHEGKLHDGTKKRLQTFNLSHYEKTYGSFVVVTDTTKDATTSPLSQPDFNYQHEDTDKHFRQCCGDGVRRSKASATMGLGDNNADNAGVNQIERMFTKKLSFRGRDRTSRDTATSLQLPLIPTLDFSRFGKAFGEKPTATNCEGLNATGGVPLVGSATLPPTRKQGQNGHPQQENTLVAEKEPQQAIAGALQGQLLELKTTWDNIKGTQEQHGTSSGNQGSQMGQNTSPDTSGSSNTHHPVPSISMRRHHPQMNERNHMFNTNATSNKNIELVRSSEKLMDKDLCLKKSSNIFRNDDSSTSTTFDSDSLSTIPEYGRFNEGESDSFSSSSSSSVSATALTVPW